jgi:hypothetical protein
MINYDTTQEETQTIEAIARRFIKLHPVDQITVEMCLMATHMNGCPLRLDHLLAARDFDFLHDLYGIHRHLNRETGKLDSFFIPKFAK